MKDTVHSAALAALVLLVPQGARAHFVLVEPSDRLQTDEFGDPVGGEQKSAPCGRGTMKTGEVTRVRAGELLHVKIIETVPHGGHYRIALASDRTELVDPQAVVEGGDCVSAATSSTLPVLADGLFVHAHDDVASGQVWETDVRMPNTPCPDCTLQVIEFMTPHPPPCFYHHCAQIEVLPAASVPDDAGTPASPGSGAATGSCQVAGHAPRVVAWPGLLLLTAVSLLRRHRRSGRRGRG